MRVRPGTGVEQMPCGGRGVGWEAEALTSALSMIKSQERRFNHLQTLRFPVAHGSSPMGASRKRLSSSTLAEARGPSAPGGWQDSVCSGPWLPQMRCGDCGPSPGSPGIPDCPWGQSTPSQPSWTPGPRTSRKVSVFIYCRVCPRPGCQPHTFRGAR